MSPLVLGQQFRRWVLTPSMPVHLRVLMRDPLVVGADLVDRDVA